MRRLKPASILTASSLLAACDGPQNYVRSVTGAARGLAALGNFVLILFSVATVAVLVLLAWIALRRRGSLGWHAPIDANDGQRWILIGGVVIPVLAFAVVFVSALRTMSAYPMEHHSAAAPDIRVVGRQWWFNAEYTNAPSLDRLEAPTEIHIPVGRPIDIELATRDVIHSFWVPKLHGKVDLVPGMINRIRIRADAPGAYSGECGEYCGPQHAHMRLQVIAQSPSEYDAWLQAQRLAAPEPSTPGQRQGQQVFMSAACPLCHTIRGTPAHGAVGPDLTHLASRQRIAGGMILNNRANLQAWIVSAQSLKPGSQMPDLAGFDGTQLNQLADYLQSLK